MIDLANDWLVWRAALPLAGALLLLYALGQGVAFLAWRRVQRAGEGAKPGPPPAVAVIVPFRNEAPHLADLAQDLLAQDYPGPTEIVFVDDHSTDGGVDLLPAGVRVLQLADHLAGRPTVAHKKAALTYAVAATDAPVIVTTDADCRWPPNRLRRVVDHHRAGAEVVLGPVLIDYRGGWCAAFQALDLAAYQFLTVATAAGGRPVLANGANFSFRRALFDRVGGYTGVDHLPSGDDVLLLHKFTAGPGLRPRIAYAPRAAVTTAPVAGWVALWRQRLRWAGKAGHYADRRLIVVQGLAFAVSLACVLLLLTAPLHPRPRQAALLLWAGKFLIDLACLSATLRTFGALRPLRWYPLVALVYPFFLVSVGAAALLGIRAEWKGR